MSGSSRWEWSVVDSGISGETDGDSSSGSGSISFSESPVHLAFSGQSQRRFLWKISKIN